MYLILEHFPNSPKISGQKLIFFQIAPTSQVNIMNFLDGWLDTKYSGPLGPLSPLGYEGHLYVSLIGVLNYKFTQITAVIQRAIGPAVSLGL